MCDLESSVVLSNVALNANLSDTSGKHFERPSLDAYSVGQIMCWITA